MTASRKRSKHRSSLFFIGGLLAAAGLAIGLDNGAHNLRPAGNLPADLSDAPVHEPLDPRPISAEDRRAAEIAWAYFAANTRAETGWVDSVAGFPSTTLWDQGSYLLALTAACELRIIPDTECDARLERLFAGLETLQLYDGRLPNKVYDTRSLRMVDYDNSISDQGIGWSALDIARMLSALRILERRQPEHADRIRRLLARWDLDAMVENGELIGAWREGGVTQYRQEGRIGYEQYGARAAALWGLDVSRAISLSRVLDWQMVYGIDVPTDLRNRNAFHAITPTLSEPYMLQGLELGLDSEAGVLADRIYRAQEARFAATGHKTMVSEDHIDQAPHFIYSSVLDDGRPWAVITEDGRQYPDLRILSTKAVFAWDALYDTAYTNFLRASLNALADPQNGWRAGIYELDGHLNDIFALNTNAVVLEAIHYTANGPLWQIR